MKRKRKPSTGEISKCKARMNVNGSKMIKRIHYEETYAPVVAWATIRFFLTLAVINNKRTRQLDFLLAFTQANIERDLYMRLPAGFIIPGKTLSEEERKKYVLKLEKNVSIRTYSERSQRSTEEPKRDPSRPEGTARTPQATDSRAYATKRYTVIEYCAMRCTMGHKRWAM
jgi:hypothetical protein